MLYLVNWTISNENRIKCWNVFGNMTPADDLKDAGEDINVVGRWHYLGGSGGVCVAECNNLSALNSWMLNWSPICEINVTPVVNDTTARESLKSKPFFQSNSENVDVAKETGVESVDVAKETGVESVDVATEAVVASVDVATDAAVKSVDVATEAGVKSVDVAKEAAVDNISVTSSILSDASVEDNEEVLSSDEDEKRKLNETINSFVAASLRQPSFDLPISRSLRQSSVNIPPTLTRKTSRFIPLSQEKNENLESTEESVDSVSPLEVEDEKNTVTLKQEDTVTLKQEEKAPAMKNSWW